MNSHLVTILITRDMRQDMSDEAQQVINCSIILYFGLIRAACFNLRKRRNGFSILTCWGQIETNNPVSQPQSSADV